MQCQGTKLVPARRLRAADLAAGLAAGLAPARGLGLGLGISSMPSKSFFTRGFCAGDLHNEAVYSFAGGG